MTLRCDVTCGRIVVDVRKAWFNEFVVAWRCLTSRCQVVLEAFGFAAGRRAISPLDELAGLVDRKPIDNTLSVISCAANGEQAWPKLAVLKAMLLSI